MVLHIDGNGVNQMGLDEALLESPGMNPIRCAVLFLFSVVSARAGTLSGTASDSEGAVTSRGI